MFSILGTKPAMIEEADALPGRMDAIATAVAHHVSGRALKGPWPDGHEIAWFAMGCYWGAERRFWQLPGVWVTAVGNMGGFTPNPTYAEVCSGRTGHAETVQVVYDPTVIAYVDLVRAFFEGHDPTQGMRQGNDVGSQYRSAIFYGDDDQRRVAESVARAYGEALAQRGLGPVTTQIAPAGPFYYAEAEHQQYLAKNPHGYCGLGGTGVACPAPAAG